MNLRKGQRVSCGKNTWCSTAVTQQHGFFKHIENSRQKFFTFTLPKIHSCYWVIENTLRSGLVIFVYPKKHILILALKHK